jgi:NAD+ kinase
MTKGGTHASGESRPGRFSGSVRRLGVVYREHTPDVLGIVDRLKIWAAARDISVDVETEAGRGPGTTLDLIENPVDLVVALGGDGTFLRASRLAVGTDIPVVGVNLGRLGFLTAIPDVHLEEGLEKVVSGDAVIEHRFRLHARIEIEGVITGEEFYALNDVVVHTTGAARVTPLTLSIGAPASRVDEDGYDLDGMEEVGSFAADGVIISTPTGSTAYSMSAGGPIIVPEVEAIVVTPICPHSLAVRPLVVPAHATLRVGSLDPDGDHQLTVDGQVVYKLEPGQRVIVSRESRPMSLVRLPGQTFFNTMRRKLNWAARPPERT